jgi:hypothetical protein
MVKLLLRAITLTVALFVLTVIGWIAGRIVNPIYDIALNNPAVQSTGFADGLDLALKIGLTAILPMLAVVGIIWLHAGPLQNDVRRRRI